MTDPSPTIVDKFISMSMKAKLLTIVGALFVIGAVTAGALYHAYPVQVSILGAATRNYFFSWSAPPGTITNAAYKAGPAASTSDRARVSNLVNLSGKMPRLHSQRLAYPQYWPS